MKKVLVLFVAALLAFAPAMEASAPPLNANTTVAISLSVAVNETLTVSATPNTVNFSGSTGNVNGSSPISVTTSWALSSVPNDPNARTKVSLYAYFTSVNALTGPTGGFIQNNQVFASANGGAMTGCTGTDPFGTQECLGNGLTLATDNSPASLWPSGTANTSIALTIALGGSPVIGNYTGTLNITAQAI